jgi:RNA recognition motif-containing protein
MENNKNSTVYISNLSYDRDVDGVKNLFTRYGSVKYVKMILDPRTNNSKGMAFVRMSSVAEASKAVEGLNGADIDGRKVKANFSIPQEGPIKKFYLTPTKETEKNNAKNNAREMKERPSKKSKNNPLNKLKSKAKKGI